MRLVCEDTDKGDTDEGDEGDVEHVKANKFNPSKNK
jgi:hypothetical protein